MARCLSSHAYCTTTFCSTRRVIRVLTDRPANTGVPRSSTGALYSAFITISSMHCSIDSSYLRGTPLSVANAETCDMHDALS